MSVGNLGGSRLRQCSQIRQGFVGADLERLPKDLNLLAKDVVRRNVVALGRVAAQPCYVNDSVLLWVVVDQQQCHPTQRLPHHHRGIFGRQQAQLVQPP